MVQIVWTDEALTWLREIHDYISADSPDAAKRVVAGIIDRAEQLAEQEPRQGRGLGGGGSLKVLKS